MKDTNGEIQSSFDPFRTFRESTTTKVSISDHTVSLCLGCLNFCFLRTSSFLLFSPPSFPFSPETPDTQANALRL